MSATSKCPTRRLPNTRVSAIYVYAGDADPATPEPEFVVNNLTCYNCGHGNGRAIYPRGFQNATITNSIFANSLEGEEFSVKLEGNSMISHSKLWMVSPVVLNGTSTATDMLNVDPMFRDPTNMDFWIAESSELRTAGKHRDGDWRYALDRGRDLRGSRADCLADRTHPLARAELPESVPQ